MCEAYLTKEVSFNLLAHGLNDSYYANGSLTITGAFDTKATVNLPAARATSVGPKGTTRCTTHTGSTLTVKNGIATIKTADGRSASLIVVETKMIDFESNPPIHVTEYKLEDRRTITTEAVSPLQV